MANRSSSCFSCLPWLSENTEPPSTSHDASENTEPPSTSHDASSSAEVASSSFPTEYHVKKILEAAAVDEENGIVNLEDLIQHISDLLDFIRDDKRSIDHHLPKSSVCVKSKEVLSEAIEAASSLKDISSVLKGIGKAHWVMAGLVVVSTILERVEVVITNREECLDLLEEMYILAEHVKQLQERSVMNENMKDLIPRAVDLIVKASIMCFVHIDSPKLSRFVSASVDKAQLVNFKQKLKIMRRLLDQRYKLCTLDIQMAVYLRVRPLEDVVRLEEPLRPPIDCTVRPPTPLKRLGYHEQAYEIEEPVPEVIKLLEWESEPLPPPIDCTVRPPTPLKRLGYHEQAYGIEEPVQEVIKLLEWESEKNAVAVMVCGFGGVGKTTLADAVFAGPDIVGCKYSKVRLFDDIMSTPNIVELQNSILRDLMMGREPVVIRTFESGLRAIRRILEKEVAFIYIDNVLDRDRLEQLLPMDMHRAKKVRVLITARDRDVCRGCRMETKLYAMNCLPESAAMILLKKELSEGLDSSQLSMIINISGGIPKVLKVFAAFIRSEEDKQKAFRMVIENQEHLKSEAFVHIEHYVFAYDNLPERFKDPFLDICVFFKGMDWDSVADIVGESVLDMLEKRALVSKDRGMTLSIHDVILMVGCQKAKGTRFNFTSSSQFEEFLQEDIPGIKGLWYDVFENTTDIPAIKLDSMSNSLRVLRLGNLKVKGECDKRFEKLVFFQGKVAHLPFNISQMTSNLKHMELNGRGHSGDFEISKRDLQQLRNLRILRLIDFAGLIKLPQQLGEIIHGLRELTVIWCSSIEELPRSIPKLQYLRVLKMDFCTSLRGLPEDIGLLSSLQELTLSNCEHIEELPESTSKLQSLETLDMYACKNLKHLPKDFESLDSLEVLSLGRCESLQVRPPIFEKFSRLQPFATDAIRDMKISIPKLENLEINI